MKTLLVFAAVICVVLAGENTMMGHTKQVCISPTFALSIASLCSCTPSAHHGVEVYVLEVVETGEEFPFKSKIMKPIDRAYESNPSLYPPHRRMLRPLT